MRILSFEMEGLGNRSYLVADPATGAAAVVDPERWPDRYVRAAADLGVRITHAFETHLHADFLSGARELAARTGASVVAGADAALHFEHLPVRDGETVRVGGLTFRAVATPGHTPEHVAYVLDAGEADGPPAAVFTGGALTAGGAARTDLISPDQTEPLARALYRSLHERLLLLPDETVVYPTHGGGSFCTADGVTEPVTTIGRARRSNRLALVASEDDFVAEALRDLPPYPDYFLRLRPVNQRGPRVLGTLPQLRPLTPAEAFALMEAGGLVVDTREPGAFMAAHIPGSYSVELSDGFASWVGWVVPPERPLTFVTSGRPSHDEIVRRLVTIGYEDLVGYLEGGVDAWRREGRPVATVPRASITEIGHGALAVDVREVDEWRAGHRPDGLHLPLSALTQRAYSLLPRDRTLAVHCGHGFRSSLAVSLLERLGFRSLVHVHDGIAAWVDGGGTLVTEASGLPQPQ